LACSHSVLSYIRKDAEFDRVAPIEHYSVVYMHACMHAPVQLWFTSNDLHPFCSLRMPKSAPEKSTDLRAGEYSWFESEWSYSAWEWTGPVLKSLQRRVWNFKEEAMEPWKFLNSAECQYFYGKGLINNPPRHGKQSKNQGN